MKAHDDHRPEARRKQFGFTVLALTFLLGIPGVVNATGPDLTVGTNRY